MRILEIILHGTISTVIWGIILAINIGVIILIAGAIKLIIKNAFPDMWKKIEEKRDKASKKDKRYTPWK